MDSSLVIAHYETLSALFGQMLEAAADGEWDRLISIEHQCGELVSDIQTLDTATKLDEAASQNKKNLINKMLVDDGEIRRHVQAWMGQLELSIHSNRQEQRLLQAYGLNPGRTHF